MLRKKERLSRVAFNRFFSLGRRYHSPLFQVIHHPHPSFHASVVVSKKVAKTAVARNALRRRVYDILRRYKTVHQVTGVFIVVIKRPAVDANYHTLKGAVENMVGRIVNTR